MQQLVGSSAGVDLKLLELLVEVVTANHYNTAGHAVSLSASHPHSPPACCFLSGSYANLSGSYAIMSGSYADLSGCMA